MILNDIFWMILSSDFDERVIDIFKPLSVVIDDVRAITILYIIKYMYFSVWCVFYETIVYYYIALHFKIIFWLFSYFCLQGE